MRWLDEGEKWRAWLVDYKVARAGGGAPEDCVLRAAWAAAALREYRCHARYISLLAREAVGELNLRFAWLEWWDATCVCREALRRLEAVQG